MCFFLAFYIDSYVLSLLSILFDIYHLQLLPTLPFACYYASKKKPLHSNTSLTSRVPHHLLPVSVHARLTSPSRVILLVARVLEDRVLFLSSSLISTIVCRDNFRTKRTRFFERKDRNLDAHHIAFGYFG